MIWSALSILSNLILPKSQKSDTIIITILWIRKLKHREVIQSNIANKDLRSGRLGSRAMLILLLYFLCSIRTWKKNWYCQYFLYTSHCAICFIIKTIYHPHYSPGHGIRLLFLFYWKRKPRYKDFIPCSVLYCKKWWFQNLNPGLSKSPVFLFWNTKLWGMKGWGSEEGILHALIDSHRKLELILSRKSSSKVSLRNFTDRDFLPANLGESDHQKTESQLHYDSSRGSILVT